jgi:branched-subunit amino acid transport protein
LNHISSNIPNSVKNFLGFVGFEVLTAVSTEIFWVVAMSPDDGGSKDL